jgi:hypothetical protein
MQTRERYDRAIRAHFSSFEWLWVAIALSRVGREWAMVENAVAAHCTNTVKEISSLLESLRQQLPEFRRAQALGYPLAGMVRNAARWPPS